MPEKSLSPVEHAHPKNSLLILTLTSMGVVFGDIGTSPLYALRECFNPKHGLTLNSDNVFGLLSLVFWSLTIIISLKYVLFIMRADNRGEGGILSLVALVQKKLSRLKVTKLTTFVTIIGLFGATLLYGDGVITPAISVLSALEGLTIIAPSFEHYVVPLTIAILIALFMVQRIGTAKIGIIFGPITLVWFLVLGGLGISQIIQYPEILLAISPVHAVNFFMMNGLNGFFILGTVFLCVTGGEAMYADMGHFGRTPIKFGWFFMVFPCLMLNYLGQGALILSRPESISNPFYLMAPSWALSPLVVLATMATVIASQALISGVFSLARQTIQLGYSPRMAIVHTSSREIGQIYVPAVNYALLIGAIALVLIFKTSSNIAHAYGIAVSLTMFITTVLAIVIAHYVWRWKTISTFLLCVPLLIVDAAFFGANVVKILDGGWIAIAIAACVLLLMTTWVTGRKLLSAELFRQKTSLETFLIGLEKSPPVRVPGTAVFMTGSADGVPHPFINNLKHNKVMHERVLFINFQTQEIPVVSTADRVSIEACPHGIWKVLVKVGFMDSPDVPSVLKQCGGLGLSVPMEEAVFFLGREIILATNKQGMAIWREKLFSFMTKNAQSPAAFFKIPPSQVIEVGMQVEI